jgi:hypothetical protein
VVRGDSPRGRTNGQATQSRHALAMAAEGAQAAAVGRMRCDSGYATRWRRGGRASEIRRSIAAALRAYCIEMRRC